MTDSLDVFLNGDHIGALQRTSSGNLSFEYLETYRVRPQATPLSCSMPLTAAHHSDRVVRPFVWGLLPENERVLSRWAREFQASPRNPLALLRSVGSDLPGSVQMFEPGEVPSTLKGEIEWLEEVDVERLLQAVQRDQSE
jgi:serine/threonine-protein kinase HipA